MHVGGSVLFVYMDKWCTMRTKLFLIQSSSSNISRMDFGYAFYWSVSSSQSDIQEMDNAMQKGLKKI